MVMIGAGVGFTHRVLMRGGIKGIPKPEQLSFANIMKKEFWTNLDRKIRIGTSQTLQSKLTNRGPVLDEFSNLLFSRPTDTVRLDWLGRVAKNQDKAIGIVGTGNAVEEVAEAIIPFMAKHPKYKAAKILEKDGIECEIIDLRTIRPLDNKTIFASVKKTNRLVILEESWPFGNISTEITYQVQNQLFDYLDAPIEKINTADTPAPFSPVLLKEWLPNSKDVIKSVKKVLYHNS